MPKKKTPRKPSPKDNYEVGADVADASEPRPVMGPEFKGIRHDSQYRRYADGRREKVDA